MMTLPGPDSVSREGIYGLRDGVEEGRAAGTAAARGGQQGSSDQLRGLAALSLDALSSVAYGPQAIMLVLVAAGTAALRLTLPVTLAISLHAARDELRGPPSPQLAGEQRHEVHHLPRGVEAPPLVDQVWNPAPQQRAPEGFQVGELAQQHRDVPATALRLAELLRQVLEALDAGAKFGEVGGGLSRFT